MDINQVVIGVDIGTTSTKAVIFEEDGRIRAMHAIEYPMLHPQPGWAEQDPHVLFSAVMQSIQGEIYKGDVSSEQVKAIGLSVAMHSLMLVDDHHRPLTNCIIWTDNRSNKQAEQLRTSEKGMDIYKRTGTPIHPMSPLAKLMWCKEHMPHVFEQVYKFISIKEYVLYHLQSCQKVCFKWFF